MDTDSELDRILAQSDADIIAEMKARKEDPTRVAAEVSAALWRGVALGLLARLRRYEPSE